MRYSEEEVYLLGVGLALLMTGLISVPCIRYMLKWFWSHPRNKSWKEVIPRGIFCGVLSVVWIWAIWKVYFYPLVVWLLVIGSVLECMVVFPIIKRINARLMEENEWSFSEEEIYYSGRFHKHTVWYMMELIILMNITLTVGGIALTTWAMPDVVEVRNVAKRASYAYDVDSYYTLPFINGLEPGRSYIDNLSIDTVYRLAVAYGVSGKDSTNYYSVKELYPPQSFSRMKSRVHHAMDTIAPWMPPSYGKTGTRRSRRTYLTDYMHLHDFITVDMRRFGLDGNTRVDAIEDVGGSMFRENEDKYRAYKAINPFPYIRLLPDSLRKHK